MKKIETIYHHLLYSAQAKEVYRHTQQAVARQFGYSLSTINLALSVPTQIGAVRKESKYFVVADFKKLLYYWASVRNLEKDIYYRTYMDLPVTEIESLVPPHSIFGGYTAGKHILKEPPADYDKIYFYTALPQAEMEKRFPLDHRRTANVYALKLPPTLAVYGAYSTLPQTFVDIWKLSDWYAHDFIQSLEAKMHGLLS